MLVEPVAHEAADDPLVPPALGADVGDPGLRRVPVVVDVVVVEDHRRSAPWRAASACSGSPHDSQYRRVYSSKSATVSPGGTSGSRRERMKSRTAGRDLVGVDLVAEQDQRLRPLRRVLLGHPLGERPQRVDLAPVGVLVLRQRVRRLVRRAHAAGAEHDPRRLVRVVGADDARRILAVRQRPHRLAVERHLVGRDRRRARAPRRPRARSGAPRRRTSSHSQSEHRDRAGPVGLDPDQRLCLPRVAERGAEDQLRHAAAASS